MQSSIHYGLFALSLSTALCRIPESTLQFGGRNQREGNSKWLRKSIQKAREGARINFAVLEFISSISKQIGAHSPRWLVARLAWTSAKCSLQQPPSSLLPLHPFASTLAVDQHFVLYHPLSYDFPAVAPEIVVAFWRWCGQNVTGGVAVGKWR